MTPAIDEEISRDFFLAFRVETRPETPRISARAIPMIRNGANCKFTRSEWKEYTVLSSGVCRPTAGVC